MQRISGQYTVLTMADSGPGIDIKTLGHILYAAFTIKGTSRGAGVGLSKVMDAC